MKLLKKYFILLVCITLCCSSIVRAEGIIDPEQLSSLTIQYNFEGLEIQIFRVAEILEDGTYVLTDSFKEYDVTMNGVTSQVEWREITSTLSSYAIADKLQPTKKSITNQDGVVVFEDILTGMYLILSVQVIQDEIGYMFENFLVSVPNTDVYGNWQYDVVSYPKSQTFIPSPELKTYEVIKQWKDTGFSQYRPTEVKVDILKDGVLQETQILSSKNNWHYSWETEDDGSRWTVVERNVAENYTVTVSQNGNKFLITNTYEETSEEAPGTGDTIVVWPYVLTMFFSGSVILILLLGRKREK